MKAMVFEGTGKPLVLKELPEPTPTANQIRIKVLACGVCRTDLHIFDGELSHPKLPLIMGHQIVGEVNSDARRFKKGDRVGVPWLGKSCGHCFYCQMGAENLCDFPLMTGYTIHGGYAESCVADEDFIFPLPKDAKPAALAPLLCAGMVGYRSLKLAGDAKKVGFYGFGAAAHLLIQLALFQKREVFAFTRPGDTKTQQEAKNLGATWSGGSLALPPQPLDAAILFAPVGELVPAALKAVRKGGKVICGGIHMSEIPSFPYSLLWEERSIQSVANLTREDGEELLKLAAEVPIRTTYTTYPLEKANEALEDLREGRIEGSAILIL